MPVSCLCGTQRIRDFAETAPGCGQGEQGGLRRIEVCADEGGGLLHRGKNINAGLVFEGYIF